MRASEVLAEVQQCGGSLCLDGDGFEYRGPAGTLTPELRDRLVEHKPELLAHLRQTADDSADEPPVSTAEKLERSIRQAATFSDLDAVIEDAQRQYEAGELDAEAVERLAALAQQEAQAMPQPADGLRLSELFREQPIRSVYSKILGETVVFARDGVDVPPDLEGVVYRASELRQLAGCSSERLRAIHTAKKVLGGELIPDAGEGLIVPVEALLEREAGQHETL